MVDEIVRYKKLELVSKPLRKHNYKFSEIKKSNISISKNKSAHSEILTNEIQKEHYATPSDSAILRKEVTVSDRSQILSETYIDDEYDVKQSKTITQSDIQEIQSLINAQIEKTNLQNINNDEPKDEGNDNKLTRKEIKKKIKAEKKAQKEKIKAEKKTEKEKKKQKQPQKDSESTIPTELQEAMNSSPGKMKKLKASAFKFSIFDYSEEEADLLEKKLNELINQDGFYDKVLPDDYGDEYENKESKFNQKNVLIGLLLSLVAVVSIIYIVKKII